MSDNTIICPQCGAGIEVGEALTGGIRTQLRQEMERESAKRQAELKKQAEALREREAALLEQEETLDDKVRERLRLERERLTEAAKAKAAEEFAGQAKALESENARQKALIKEAQSREMTLLQRQRELEEREAAVALEIERKIEGEREAIRKEAARVAEEAAAGRAKSLEEENARQKALIQDAQQRELGLLQRQREVEDREAALKLEVQRTLTEERAKIQEAALAQATEAQALKLRERDDLIERLKREMAEVQRRAQVGSQEGQGEALEEQMQERLEAAFPMDQFDAVKKGARGADIVQLVNGRVGSPSGKILWETKNTKDFSPAWLAKLKADQQAENADIAVLASVALPAGVKDFAFLEDHSIWVTGYTAAPALCAALRQTLTLVARERRVAAYQDSMKDVLYQYITGHEFARRVRAIVHAYQQMQQDLDAERRSMARIWKKREKQIGVVLDNVTEMYGEIEGLAGAGQALPQLQSLTLEAIADEDEGAE